MGKRNNRNLQQLYSNPLPITLTSEFHGSLPEVFPHNPISWLYFGYRYIYLQTRNVPQSYLDPVRLDLEDGIFQVLNENDQNRLWRQGFFGKGTLSRSDPSWKIRISRRLNLRLEEKDVTIEEVTNLRRDERKKFKLQRAKLQELELKQKKNEISKEELINLEQIRLDLSILKNAEINTNLVESQLDFDNLRDEDKAMVVKESGKLVANLEFLQLQYVEAFFLAVALNVADVYQNNDRITYKQLFNYCCRTTQLNEISRDHTFILNYVVYHHYRSLGWCVRSGIKFGCDFLLYKRGPPFTHAEYSIMVIPNVDNNNSSWFDMCALLRVIAGVKKNLVLTFVDVPEEQSFNEILCENLEDEKKTFYKLLQSYKVTEILYRRWVPSRSRD